MEMIKRTASTRLPTLIVFDLDACLWEPETFQLPSMPTLPVRGPLGSAGEGVVALKCRDGPAMQLFDGALEVLQILLLAIEAKATEEDIGAWQSVRLAVASSSLEPSYSYAALEALEVVPGRSLKSMLSFEAVGREGELSPDKTTHFGKIGRESGIPFNEMLFFDDCIWGDNVARVDRALGVPGVRTPRGLTLSLFQKGLALFAERSG